MMTTMAALLGALPLALGPASVELRRPLGIAIVVAHREPGADALHDAGRIPLPRPLRLWWARGRAGHGLAPLRPRMGSSREAPDGLRAPRRPLALASALLLLASACTVGPDYVRPSMWSPTPTRSSTAGGSPSLGTACRGPWWRSSPIAAERLEARVSISNQNSRSRRPVPEARRSCARRARVFSDRDARARLHAVASIDHVRLRGDRGLI